jgi:hypothetical protein
VEYPAIAKRTLIQRWRNQMHTKLNYLSSVIIAVVASVVFFGVGRNQASVRNRTGAVFFLFVHPVFSAIFEVTMPLVMDAPTLVREYKNKHLYRVTSYYLARTTGELPIQATFPLIYVSILYWAVGFGGLGEFLILAVVLQLACFTGQSYGYMLSTLSVNFETSMVISIVFLVSVFLFSGMMVDATTLSEPLASIGQLSLFKHAFDAGMIAVWRDVELQCDAGEVCDFARGEEVLRSYNIGMDSTVDAHLTRALLVMAGLSVLTRLLGYVRLCFRYAFEDDWRNLCRGRGTSQAEECPSTGDAARPESLGKGSAESAEVRAEV